MAAPTVADRHGMNHDLQFRGGESLLGPCSMLTAHYESSSTGWKLRTFILNHSFSSTTFTLFYVTWIEFARNSIFSCNGETPHCRIVHGFLASALCIAQVTLSHRTNMLPTQIYNISSSQDFSADPSAPPCWCRPQLIFVRCQERQNQFLAPKYPKYPQAMPSVCTEFQSRKIDMLCCACCMCSDNFFLTTKPLLLLTVLI